MWRDASGLGGIVRGAARLLRLELQLMTGGKALLILLAQVAWLVLMTTLQRFREEPWDPASFYNRTVLVPCLVPAVALGMSCILAERDERHLEMSFASPGGRYLLWSFRLAALAIASFLSCALLATGTWFLGGQEIVPWTAAAHALVPVLMAASLAAFLALLFNGTASAGLVSGALLVLAAMFLHGPRVGRFDPYVNPFAPPDDLRDPGAWIRILVFNRIFLLTLTGAFVAGILGLLQRRERLL